MEEIPHLDLYNFSEPSACDSPYVLTSPRSLQVFFCSSYLIHFFFKVVAWITVLHWHHFNPQLFLQFQACARFGIKV